MISWWIGSASRPHGVGQCGRDVAGLGQLAAAWAAGCAASHARDGEAAGVVVGRELEVHAVELSDARRVRPAVESEPGGTRCRAGTSPTRGRSSAGKVPDAQCQVQGDRRVTWGEFDRRANGVARILLDRGAQEQDKVAQYLQNCPEYLESMFAVVQGRAGADQHQLPLRRRRARLPVGQRRLRRRRVPRRRSPTRIERIQRPGARA